MSTEKVYCNIYRRVSSKKQESGLSLEAQEKFLRDFAKENGYLVIEDFSATESAKEEGRIKFNKMVKHCVDNNIKHILVEKTDRLQRSKKDEIFIEDLIKKNELYFHLVKEGRVMSKDGSSTDQLLSDVQGMIARHEIRVLKERVAKGLRAKVDRNELPCQAPVGYENIARTKTSPNKVIPDKNFEKVKKFLMIFNEGKRSLNDMVRVANNLGLKSRRGNELHRSTVAWILKNPFYYGEFKYEEKLYENKTRGFVSMITKKQFEKNQKILEDQRLNKSDERGIAWKFKDFVHCDKCGRIFLAEQTTIKYKSKKTKKEIVHKYIQYHCTKGFYYADDKGNITTKDFIKEDEFGNPYYEEKDKRIYMTKKKCNTGCIREDELGRLLTAEFGVIKFKKTEWNKVKNQLLKSKKESRNLIADELEMLRSEYSKNKTKQETLYDDKIEGTIPEKFFEEQMKKITDRQFEIEGRIKWLEDEQDFIDNKIQKAFGAIDTIDNFGKKFIDATPKIKKGMVDLMCSKIYLLGGEKMPNSKKKFPYELYVEWNDEFNELYEVGLIEMAEESRSKYGLPKKVKVNISTQNNNLDWLD